MGKIHGEKDISAIVSFGKSSDESFDKFLSIGSDESRDIVQILTKKNSETYEVDPNLRITLPVSEFKEDEEIDIEGMSVNYNKNDQTVTLFIVGSHSLKRSKVKEDKKYIKNREKIIKVIPEDKKNTIFVVTLDVNTAKQVGETKIINIKDIIDSDPILERFTNIPSKENGVDIEGIAADGKTLYLGFRGPVLRENYVPIMVIDDWEEKDKSEYELRFIQLGGNGIRDITKVKDPDGFLIIAGPVGDGNSPYQLYFWNGIDGIPGKDKAQIVEKPILLENLEEIKPSDDFPNAKPEGITVIEETDSHYTVIIVYDSVENGGATKFKVPKPKFKP